MGAQILPSQPTVPLKNVANVPRPPRRSGRIRRQRENSDPAPQVLKFPNLVPGSVTILKRGEVLKTKTASNKSAADEKRPTIDEAKREKKAGSPDLTSSILKRGEVLKTKTASNKSAADEKRPTIDEAKRVKKAGSTDWTPCTVSPLGPGPEMVPKQRRISYPKPIGVVYAGSGFNTSPEPSSLPLPGFFAKAAGRSDLATDDIRRLLRLDLL